ncbi:MAG: hypothetical protein J7K53_03295 [Bacteroidales bacterium]|nr:hypothetical protein [Bacteroidales bacterium]
MKFRQLFLLTAFSLFIFTAHSQIITSNKSSIHINNKIIGKIDYSLPVITLIYPDITQEADLVTDKNALNILGKVTAVNGINSIYINQRKINTSDNDFFSAEISLKPGKNDISIILIDSIYQFVEKNFTVIHNTEIIPADTVETDTNNLYRTQTVKYTYRKNNVSLIKNPAKTELINALNDLIDEVTLNDNLLICIKRTRYKKQG